MQKADGVVDCGAELLKLPMPRNPFSPRDLEVTTKASMEFWAFADLWRQASAIQAVRDRPRQRLGLSAPALSNLEKRTLLSDAPSERASMRPGCCQQNLIRWIDYRQRGVALRSHRGRVRLGVR